MSRLSMSTFNIVQTRAPTRQMQKPKATKRKPQTLQQSKQIRKPSIPKKQALNFFAFTDTVNTVGLEQDRHQKAQGRVKPVLCDGFSRFSVWKLEL